jgi:thiol-disulfide isomerase/thioredoxin
MKMKTFIPAVVAVSLFLYGGSPRAAEKPDAKAQLQELVLQIQGKLKEGKNTEKDLAEDLKRFDELLASHKDEKTDDVAQILFMKAMLYLQVFDDTTKGLELIKTLKKDFPETSQGKKVDEIVEAIQKQAEAKKIQDALAEGSKFPDFAEKDLEGKPLSVANFKGKILLIDFWATWCGPCVHELPNVLETYEKYHEKGFEIIGISLDKEEAKLTSFLKEKKMTWPQFFDGKGWQNKLAGKYGINSIPATYLLDGEGTIIGKNLRGEALASAVDKALAK